MSYEPRTITFLGRDGLLKHHGIALHDRIPRPQIVAATRRAAHHVIPDGAFGFTIADGTVLACVWEMEVIDFERRAWLEDVLKAQDAPRYGERVLEEVEL